LSIRPDVVAGFWRTIFPIAHPILLVVGYCTTTTAKVLAVFASGGLRVARLLYKAGAQEDLNYADVVPQHCPPYQMASFALEHLV